MKDKLIQSEEFHTKETRLYNDLKTLDIISMS